MIDAYLNGVLLPKLGLPFIENIIENAVDVVTLDGTMHTDFVNQRQGFGIRWDQLSLEDYETIRAIYNSQFDTSEYPEFTCDYFDVIDVPCRMFMNDRDVRVMGCEVYDIEVKLVKSGSSNNGSSS